MNAGCADKTVKSLENACHTERFRDVFTTRRYTNPILPYLTYQPDLTAQIKIILSFLLLSDISWHVTSVLKRNSDDLANCQHWLLFIEQWRVGDTRNWPVLCKCVLTFSSGKTSFLCKLVAGNTSHVDKSLRRRSSVSSNKAPIGQRALTHLLWK